MSTQFQYQTLPVELTRDNGKPISPKPGKFTVNGKPIILKLYPLNVLAKNLNRASYTLRRWEHFGWIPPTFRIKKARYYTKSQIQLLMYLSMKHDIRHKDNVGKEMPQAFIDDVHNSMKELRKCILTGLVPSDLYETKAEAVAE